MDQTYNQPQRRRTRKQWLQLIEEWQRSGESAKHFCTERSISYASFCQWRKRLSATAPATEQEAAPGFIDLGALTQGRAGGWHIVLSLGNGVELRLSQG